MIGIVLIIVQIIIPTIMRNSSENHSTIMTLIAILRAGVRGEAGPGRGERPGARATIDNVNTNNGDCNSNITHDNTTTTINDNTTTNTT